MKRVFWKNIITACLSTTVLCAVMMVGPLTFALSDPENAGRRPDVFLENGELTPKPGIFVGATFEHESNLVFKDESGVRQKISLKILPGKSDGSAKFDVQDLKIVSIDFPQGIRLIGTNTYVEFNRQGEGSYSILVPGTVPAGKYPVTYTFEYRGTKIKVTETLDIEDMGNGQHSADLHIFDIQLPSSVYVENIFDLSFSVSNVGSATAQNVEIALELPAGMLNMSQGNFMIPQLYPGRSATYSVKLKANQEMENKFHNIKITATPTGGTEAGNPQAKPGQPSSVYTGTVVVGGNGGKEGKGGKPLFIMDSYEFTRENGEKTQVVQAGENVVLDFKLKNTSPKALRNIKLTFSAEGGVLVPNNTSNTFYEPVVGAGGYVFETLPLTVLATAEQKATPCTINLYYEFGNGDALETAEVFTVNVIQNTKLDIAEQKGPDGGAEVEVGAPVMKAFNLINLGKTVLSNLRMTIEGPGIESENPTVFIGNMAPGTSQGVEVNYSFTEPGKKEYKVIFVFEDAAGKEVKEERKFVTEVVEAVVLPPEVVEPLPEEHSSVLVSVLKWVVGLALVAAIVVTAVLLKRSKKKKQARLEMDD